MLVDHDQFAKEVLRVLLQPLAEVESEHEVAHEPQRVDLCSSPRSGVDFDAAFDRVGFLATMARRPALVEVFSSAVTLGEVRGCLRKQLAVGHVPGEEEAPHPQLWVLSAGDPRTAARRLGLRGRRGFPRGFLFAPDALALCVVALPRLPRTRATLPLRLLGVGQCRAQAAADLAKLRRDDPMRGAMAELVVREAFVRQISGTGPASKDDAMFEEEFQRFKRELQTAAQAEGERLGRQEGERLGRQEGERLGRQEGERLGVEKGQRLLVERLLRARFGSLDETASARLQSASEEQLTSMALRIGQAASLEEVLRAGISGEVTRAPGRHR